MKLTRLKELLGAMNSGAATKNTKSLFLKTPMQNVPVGQCFQTCLEGEGKWFECMVDWTL